MRESYQGFPSDPSTCLLLSAGGFKYAAKLAMRLETEIMPHSALESTLTGQEPCHHRRHRRRPFRCEFKGLKGLKECG